MAMQYQPTVSQDEINYLNAGARNRVAAGEDAIGAMANAARSRGYEEVDRDECMVVYARGSNLPNTPEVEYVACWIEAPSALIEDGGMGFDDQTELCGRDYNDWMFETTHPAAGERR